MRSLTEFYNGFTIREPVGNNAFSYTESKQKQIYVAPIIEGGLDDLKVGEEIVFSEILDGVEHNKKGLAHFLSLRVGKKQIFIFDNHNHAFFFWMWGLHTGEMKSGLPLVHVDQHSDMREPTEYLELGSLDAIDLEAVFAYTQNVLNVGCFLKPALDLNIFSRLEKVDGIFALEKSFDEEIVLDIDMDIFAGVDPDEYGCMLERIRDYMRLSDFITIVTSPYFMDQPKAIEMVKELLGTCP